MSLIKRLINKSRERKFLKLQKKLADVQLKAEKKIEFIVIQEQPLINTLTGYQKEIEEAKLKQKIDKAIKKEKKEIEKLSEEIKKMAGKLKLKDGKLVRVDDPVAQEPQQQVPQPPSQYTQQPPIPPQFIQQPQPQYAQPQPQYAQPQPQYAQPQPQYAQPQPQYATHDEQFDTEVIDEYLQNAQRIPPQQNVPRTQMSQQPTNLTVHIYLIDGRAVQVSVPGETAEDFFREINEAIENQSVMQIANEVFNGRHIINYKF